MSTSRSAPELVGRPVPTLGIGTVWHVGTMRVADKGRAGASHQSYEGGGLSVSTCPDDWEAIASLGGLPHWELRRGDHRFLDAHELAPDQRAEVIGWAVAEGYAAQARGWRVSYEDAEDAELRWFNCVDHEEALGEAEEVDGEVEPVEVLVPTDSLRDRVGGFSDPALVEDHVLTVWAEDCTDLDGVWWEDSYDPAALSAPRGVILPSRVANWTVSARESD